MNGYLTYVCSAAPPKVHGFIPWLPFVWKKSHSWRTTCACLPRNCVYIFPTKAFCDSIYAYSAFRTSARDLVAMSEPRTPCICLCKSGAYLRQWSLRVEVASTELAPACMKASVTIVLHLLHYKFQKSSIKTAEGSLHVCLLFCPKVIQLQTMPASLPCPEDWHVHRHASWLASLRTRTPDLLSSIEVYMKTLRVPKWHHNFANVVSIFAEVHPQVKH